MIEVHPNLFVGHAVDEATLRHELGWFIISAAKEPWHRAALGYTGVAAPKDHAEYLMASRPGKLILNLVDALDPAYVSDTIVDMALATIDAMRPEAKVLVHCNQGISRSPTLALLYMARHTDRFAGMDFDRSVEQFRAIYPSYAPARGMASYAKSHWPTP